MARNFILLISFLLFFKIISANNHFNYLKTQKDSTAHFDKGEVMFGFQGGGQSVAAIYFEAANNINRHLAIDAKLGLGHIWGNDVPPVTKSYTSIQTGFSFLGELNPFFVEVGIIPSLYFHDGISFVNLNGIFGIGLMRTKYHDNVNFNKILNFSFIEFVYNPILYGNYKNQDFISNTTIWGLRFGFHIPL